MMEDKPWIDHEEKLLFKCEHGGEFTLDYPKNAQIEFDAHISFLCGCEWFSPPRMSAKKWVEPDYTATKAFGTMSATPFWLTTKAYDEF